MNQREITNLVVHFADLGTYPKTRVTRIRSGCYTAASF